MAAPSHPLEAFIWGRGGSRRTPEQIAREKEIAEALMGQGVDTSPVGHWLQGAARVATAGAGAFRDHRAGQAEKANATASQQNIASLLQGLTGGGGGGGQFPPAPGGQAGGLSHADNRVMSAHGAAGDMGAYRDAIASIESRGSGDYAAVGPKHSRLGRALGRYQIMEANIGPWSRKHLGREVTPDEFMQNPAIQDAIFDGEFGGYVQQFGPEGAAQAWFAGPGGVGKMGRQDSLGTSVAAYTDKFNRALGGRGQSPGSVIGAEDVEWLRANAPTDGSPYSGPGSTFAAGDIELMEADRRAREQAQMDAATPPWMLEMIQGSQANPYAASGTTDATFAGMQQGAPQPPLAMPGEEMTPPMGAPQEVPEMQVAQALTGQQMAPIEAAGGAGMLPAPGGGMGGGINPQIIEALSSPYASEQERQIAGLLLNQHMEQQKAQQAQQQRMQMAQQAGIDPRFAGDDELWKGAVGEQFRAPPTSIQEFEYGRDDPGFYDHLERMNRAKGTQVDARNMGNIPPGYRVEYDEQGNPVQMAPIPGGPVAREDEESQRAARQRQQNISMAGGTVVQDLGRGMEVLESSDWAAGPQALALKNVPGTSSYLLNQFLESVASNIGVDRLQAMREASPTGGALGQVPFQQQKRLEQLLGSLDITQPKDVLRDNMSRISNLYMDLIHGSPEEIMAQVSQGVISAEEALPMVQRFDLSFDEMGRPRQQGQSSRQAPAASQSQVPADFPDPELWEFLSEEDRRLWQN